MDLLKAIDFVVCDVDGTLYDINDVIDLNYEIQKEFLFLNYNMTYEKIEELFKKNSIFSKKSKKAKSCTELFLRMGIEKERWNEFREKHFNTEKIQKDKAVSLENLYKLCKEKKVILLTSNSYKNVCKIMNYLGISAEIFENIICEDNCPYPVTFNKKEVMKNIIGDYHILPSRMISIGDRYETDIKPMLELHGWGCLAENPGGVNHFIEYMLYGGKREPDFQLYGGLGK